MSTDSNLSPSDTPKRFVWKGSGPASHLKLDFGIGMMSSARNLRIQLEAGRVLDDDIRSAASNCRQQRAYDLLDLLDALMIGAETITLADILKIDAARDRLLVACVAEGIINGDEVSEASQLKADQSKGGRPRPGETVEEARARRVSANSERKDNQNG